MTQGGEYMMLVETRLLWDSGLLTSNNVTLVVRVSVSYIQKEEGAVGIGHVFSLSVRFLRSVLFDIQLTDATYHTTRGKRRLRRKLSLRTLLYLFTTSECFSISCSDSQFMFQYSQTPHKNGEFISGFPAHHKRLISFLPT